MASSTLPRSSNCKSQQEEGKFVQLEIAEATSHSSAELRHNKLGWKNLTICLIVEAIALGTLGIPFSFSRLGMLLGILLTVGFGLLTIFAAHIIGWVKIKHPSVLDYADAVRLMSNRFGYEVASVMYVAFLVLVTGSHVLTGTMAFTSLIQQEGLCALIYGAVAAVLLFLLALPPTFSKFTFLGYIDFISILGAIGITIIASGILATDEPGGFNAVAWSWLPKEGLTFHEAFLSVTNIVFAYSFTVCQFAIMSEMHTPKDFNKSVWSIGTIEVVLYTLTGALTYAFAGEDVLSPALLVGPAKISRIAFAVAVPVIFISGAINSTVVGKYVLSRAFPDPESQYRLIRGKAGWMVWISVMLLVTVIAFVVAEAIPFFNELLGVISSLFISGFSFYFPALFYFRLLKTGKWNKDWKSTCLSALSALILVIGITVAVVGCYSSVKSIVIWYQDGPVGGSFTCSQDPYFVDSGQTVHTQLKDLS